MVLRHILCLCLILLKFDNETMCNYVKYCISSELVFAIVEIQMHRRQEVLNYSRQGNSINAGVSLSYLQQSLSNHCPSQSKMDSDYQKTILRAERKFKREMSPWITAMASVQIRYVEMEK